MRRRLPTTDPELRAALERTKELLRDLPDGDLKRAILERRQRIERRLPAAPQHHLNLRR